MSQDLTMYLENDIVNFRVGAIIVQNGKVLMAHSHLNSYYHSIGGRIQFGESSITAVQREVFEETGYHLDVERLCIIHENFFTGYGKRKDAKVHEIEYIFLMHTPDDFNPNMKHYEDGEFVEELVWIDENTTFPYYPKFLKELIMKDDFTFHHIITRDGIDHE